MQDLFILLQAELPKAPRGAEMLFQYGVLGLFAVILLYAIWYMEKERKKREQAMLDRMKWLENEMKVQQREHQLFIETTYKHSVEVNEHCINLLQEVKEMLHRHKF